MFWVEPNLMAHSLKSAVHMNESYRILHIIEIRACWYDESLLRKVTKFFSFVWNETSERTDDPPNTRSFSSVSTKPCVRQTRLTKMHTVLHK
jgi:hypothetical protein